MDQDPCRMLTRVPGLQKPISIIRATSNGKTQIFKGTKVSTKLALGFGVVVLLLIVVTVSTVFRIRAINDDIANIVDDRSIKLSLGSGMTLRPSSLPVRQAPFQRSIDKPLRSRALAPSK